MHPTANVEKAGDRKIVFAGSAIMEMVRLNRGMDESLR